jgi:hypothetical protein
MRRAAERREPMARITESAEGHYETREVPFGKTYEWHPARITLQCECGGKLILTATSTMTACSRCGADLRGVLHDVKERESHLPDRLTHPWFYDAKERSEQHQHDEGAYPKGSPFRYNDITEDEV